LDIKRWTKFVNRYKKIMARFYENFTKIIRQLWTAPRSFNFCAFMTICSIINFYT
jgi:DNA-binding ferritin-like protein (Dps family)